MLHISLLVANRCHIMCIINHNELQPSILYKTKASTRVTVAVFVKNLRIYIRRRCSK